MSIASRLPGILVARTLGPVRATLSRRGVSRTIRGVKVCGDATVFANDVFCQSQGSRTTTDCRIGLGADCHALGAGGKPLRIGGVAVEASLGVVAHSDGDVLLHALTDALLGSLSLGDIGSWFPDSEGENQDRDSSEFVFAAAAELWRRGWQPVNVDSTVHLERPKLGPAKDRMRQRISELLRLPLEAVSVKAKSGEGVGPVGRAEAIEAQVIVLVQRMVGDRKAVG